LYRYAYLKICDTTNNFKPCGWNVKAVYCDIFSNSQNKDRCLTSVGTCYWINFLLHLAKFFTVYETFNVFNSRLRNSLQRLRGIESIVWRHNNIIQIN
jgi:hypothetical protein